eukprot:31793_1
MMSVLHSLIVILICVNSQPGGFGPTGDPTGVPTAQPSKSPTRSPIPTFYDGPTTNPTAPPSTKQFTEVKNIVLTATFADFEQYAIDNGLTLTQAAEDAMKQLFATSPSQEEIDIVVLDVTSGSIIITYSITGPQSAINEVDNTINNAIANSVPITLGSLTLTPDSAGTGLLTQTPSKSPTQSTKELLTQTPSKSPAQSTKELTINSASGSEDSDSDSSDIIAGKEILGLNDKNNDNKQVDEVDITIYVSD